MVLSINEFFFLFFFSDHSIQDYFVKERRDFTLLQRTGWFCFVLYEKRKKTKDLKIYFRFSISSMLDANSNNVSEYLSFFSNQSSLVLSRK